MDFCSCPFFPNEEITGHGRFSKNTQATEILLCCFYLDNSKLHFQGLALVDLVQLLLRDKMSTGVCSALTDKASSYSSGQCSAGNRLLSLQSKASSL